MSDKAERKIEVMIVADHPVLRLGLRDLVHRELDMELRCEAKCAATARIQYLACYPDVTVVDLDLPNGDGWKTVRAILALNPQAPIVGLTTGKPNVPQDIGQAALVFISKSAPSDDIVRAARLAGSRQE